MNWEQAKIVLRNGGKITRPRWEAEHFWVMSKDGYERILCHNGTNARVHIKQLEENDWELFTPMGVIQKQVNHLGWNIASRTEKALIILNNLGIHPKKCFLDVNLNLVIPIQEIDNA